MTLIGRAGTEGKYPADGSRVPCDAEGRFEIAGIPFGTWDVVLECKFAKGQYQVPLRVVLATVRLDGDAPVEVRADLGYLRPAPLRGTVAVDGQLARNRRIQLMMRRPNLRYFGRDVREIPIAARTDGDGRFEQIVPPGTYGIVVSTVDGKRRIDSSDMVVVPAGRVTTKNFVVKRRRVRVRILDADGQAVKRRKFQVWYADKLGGAFVTDGEGRMSVDPAPLVTFDLRSWPPALAGQKAQLEFIRTNPYPKWTEVLVRVGPVSMQAGRGGGEITLADASVAGCTTPMVFGFVLRLPMAVHHLRWPHPARRCTDCPAFSRSTEHAADHTDLPAPTAVGLLLARCGPPPKIETPRWTKHLELHVDNARNTQMEVEINGHKMASIPPFGTWSWYLADGSYRVTASHGGERIDELDVVAAAEKALDKHKMHKIVFNPGGVASYQLVEQRHGLFGGSRQLTGDPIRGERVIDRWYHEHLDDLLPATVAWRDTQIAAAHAGQETEHRGSQGRRAARHRRPVLREGADCGDRGAGIPCQTA